MKTELQDMADRLQGYSDEDYYEIRKAEKNTDGSWSIEIIHTVKEDEGEQNESN